MKCDICDYSTDGITNLTHHKKIHYTPEQTIWLYQMWQRVLKQISFTSILSDPSKNKVKAWKHDDNIHKDIKRFSCQPCGQIFRQKCMLSFHIEIKHPDPNLTCPFRNGVVRYARNHIPQFKSLKRTHKVG